MATPAIPAIRCLSRVTPRTAVQFSRQTRGIHQLPRGPFKPPQCSTSRALQAHRVFEQRRHGSFAANAKSLWKEYPFSVTLATAAIIFGSGCLFYVNYYYQTYIIGAFHKYPEPVAVKLRRALYYTNQDPRPKEALKYYKQALEVAEEVGMDPFSDEIMGVKIQIAFFMERIGQYGKAIQVLEILKRDSLAWIDKFGDLDQAKKQRTHILAKCIAMSVKLGELYGTPEIWDRDTAESRLVWAVETSLKEKQRRDTLHVKDEDEGPWLSDEELGAQMEALAHTYEEKDQHYLAAPLFLQALSLHPAQTCHQVILMNNLASSLAQQSPRAAAAAQAYAQSKNIQEQQPGPPATRETMLKNASAWAQKALAVAAGIKPPERDEECDVGCAVATHNLGEFAEMSNNLAEAKARYQEAIGLARAIGFEEGVEQSSKRLRKLGQTT